MMKIINLHLKDSITYKVEIMRNSNYNLMMLSSISQVPTNHIIGLRDKYWNMITISELSGSIFDELSSSDTYYLETTVQPFIKSRREVNNFNSQTATKVVGSTNYYPTGNVVNMNLMMNSDISFQTNQLQYNPPLTTCNKNKSKSIDFNFSMIAKPRIKIQSPKRDSGNYEETFIKPNINFPLTTKVTAVKKRVNISENLNSGSPKKNTDSLNYHHKRVNTHCWSKIKQEDKDKEWIQRINSEAEFRESLSDLGGEIPVSAIKKSLSPQHSEDPSITSPTMKKSKNSRVSHSSTITVNDILNTDLGLNRQSKIYQENKEPTSEIKHNSNLRKSKYTLLSEDDKHIISSSKPSPCFQAIKNPILKKDSPIMDPGNKRLAEVSNLSFAIDEDAKMEQNNTFLNSMSNILKNRKDSDSSNTSSINSEDKSFSIKSNKSNKNDSNNSMTKTNQCYSGKRVLSLPSEAEVDPDGDIEGDEDINILHKKQNNFINFRSNSITDTVITNIQVQMLDTELEKKLLRKLKNEYRCLYHYIKNNESPLLKDLLNTYYETKRKSKLYLDLKSILQDYFQKEIMNFLTKEERECLNESLEQRKKNFIDLFHEFKVHKSKNILIQNIKKTIQAHHAKEEENKGKFNNKRSYLNESEIEGEEIMLNSYSDEEENILKESFCQKFFNLNSFDNYEKNLFRVILRNRRLEILNLLVQYDESGKNIYKTVPKIRQVFDLYNNNNLLELNNSSSSEILSMSCKRNSFISNTSITSLHSVMKKRKSIKSKNNSFVKELKTNSSNDKPTTKGQDLKKEIVMKGYKFNLSLDLRNNNHILDFSNTNNDRFKSTQEQGMTKLSSFKEGNQDYEEKLISNVMTDSIQIRNSLSNKNNELSSKYCSTNSLMNMNSYISNDQSQESLPGKATILNRLYTNFNNKQASRKNLITPKNAPLRQSTNSKPSVFSTKKIDLLNKLFKELQNDGSVSAKGLNVILKNLNSCFIEAEINRIIVVDSNSNNSDSNKDQQSGNSKLQTKKLSSASEKNFTIDSGVLKDQEFKGRLNFYSTFFYASHHELLLRIKEEKAGNCKEELTELIKICETIDSNQLSLNQLLVLLQLASKGSIIISDLANNIRRSRFEAKDIVRKLKHVSNDILSKEEESREYFIIYPRFRVEILCSFNDSIQAQMIGFYKSNNQDFLLILLSIEFEFITQDKGHELIDNLIKHHSSK